jgi:hypothetical protein
MQEEAMLHGPGMKKPISVFRRWAIRRLLRSEFPDYAERVDQFPQRDTGTLLLLATPRQESSANPPALPPTPRPRSDLWFLF